MYWFWYVLNFLIITTFESLSCDREVERCAYPWVVSCSHMDAWWGEMWPWSTMEKLVSAVKDTHCCWFMRFLGHKRHVELCQVFLLLKLAIIMTFTLNIPTTVLDVITRECKHKLTHCGIEFLSQHRIGRHSKSINLTTQRCPLCTR